MRVRPTVTGARLSLWRAVVLFRVVSVLFCLALIVHARGQYTHAVVAYGVGAAMVATTAVVGALALADGPIGGPSSSPTPRSPWD